MPFLDMMFKDVHSLKCGPMWGVLLERVQPGCMNKAARSFLCAELRLVTGRRNAGGRAALWLPSRDKWLAGPVLALFLTSEE